MLLLQLWALVVIAPLSNNNIKTEIKNVVLNSVVQIK